MNGPSINSSFELPATLGCSWKASLWLKCLILREFLWLGVSEVILYGTLNITLFFYRRNDLFLVITFLLYIIFIGTLSPSLI